MDYGHDDNSNLLKIVCHKVTVMQYLVAYTYTLQKYDM